MWRRNTVIRMIKTISNVIVQNAVFSIFRIENGLLRREPTISQWAGYYMANTDKWYFAYTIDGDTITVVDARYAQNMRD